MLHSSEMQIKPQRQQNIKNEMKLKMGMEIGMKLKMEMEKGKSYDRDSSNGGLVGHQNRSVFE